MILLQVHGITAQTFLLNALMDLSDLLNLLLQVFTVPHQDDPMYPVPARMAPSAQQVHQYKTLLNAELVSTVP